MAKKEVKTNAMRLLEKGKIPYEFSSYECEEFTDGLATADRLGLPYEHVYKTLVTTGKSGQHYVFVIPVAEELDLKKAAKAAGEKSCEMLPVKEITNLTGYVRGGCTAVGMKKQFPTFIDNSASSLTHIYVSAGKIGAQLKVKPDDWKKASRGEYADVIFKKEE